MDITVHLPAEKAEYKSENSMILYLKVAINYFGNLAKTRGYIFLNQMLEHLNIPIIKTGQTFGYDKDSDIYITYRYDYTIDSYIINFYNLINLMDALWEDK